MSLSPSLSAPLLLLLLSCQPQKTLDQDSFPDSALIDLDSDGFAAEDDCDDADATTFPGAFEVCSDDHDSDCDGEDNSADCDPPEWPSDMDADGDGQQAEPSGTDCDDADRNIYAGAPELCDFVDNDCDGEIDEDGALDGQTVYVDEDGDGYGQDGTEILVCLNRDADAPDGTSFEAGDCDDADPDLNLAAVEACNQLDDDCDGEIDEDGATGSSTTYADRDGDGAGDPNDSRALCGAEEPYTVASGDDCDDDDVDYICTNYYLDGDGDGAGDGAGDATSEVCVCDWPGVPYTTDGNDCDDGAANVYPGAAESCLDDIDSDCDESLDDSNAVDADVYYEDADGDGYGDPGAFTKGCSQPPNTTEDNQDCDDSDPSINPAAIEVCDDYDVDENCDGSLVPTDGSAASWFIDLDEDGHGAEGSDIVEACYQPAGYADNSDDCDDADPLVHPDLADDDCDGLDDNCDGVVDEEMNETWYYDADSDGYGDPDLDYVVSMCETLFDDYVPMRGTDPESGLDCDDEDAVVNPGEAEICGNGLDDNCDGVTDECESTGA